MVFRRTIRRLFVSAVRKVIGTRETKTVTSLPTITKAPVVSVHVARTTPSGGTQQVGTYIRSSGGSVTQVSGITKQQAQRVETKAQTDVRSQIKAIKRIEARRRPPIPLLPTTRPKPLSIPISQIKKRAISLIERGKRRREEEIKKIKERQKKAKETRAKLKLERTKTQKAITNFGLKIEEKIEGLRLSTLKTLSPSFKRETNRQTQEYGRIENRFNDINKRINSFDKKFIGRELNQREFDQASKESKNLENRIINYDRLVERTKKDQNKRLKEEQKLGPFKPFTLGVISAPFSLASFSTALLTRPGVGKEFIKGVKEIPAQFIEAPITTPAEITGQLVGTALLFKGGTSLKRIASNKSLVQSGKSFIIEKPGKIKKTPLSVTFPEEFKLRINEKNVNSFIKQQLKNRGIDFNKLSQAEKDFLRGQVKAKIRNNPELFIPKSRRQALRNVKKTELKKVIQERLEGKFDKPIILKSKKAVRKLTPIQRKALKRFAQREESVRIKRAVKKRLKVKKERIPLSKSQLDFIKSRLRARIRADPSLILPKALKKALKKAKTKSEIEKIRKAVKKRLKVKKEKPIQLSEEQKGFIKSKIRSLIKTQPKRFIPKQRRQALKRFKEQQEKKVIKRAIRKGPKKLKLSDLLSKSDKEFIRRQIKAQARTSPERFIPKPRRQALIQIQKPKVKTTPLRIKIVSGELTTIQKLALKRLRKINKRRIKTTKTIKNLKEKQITIQKRIKTTTKQIQKGKKEKRKFLSQEEISRVLGQRLGLSKKDVRLLGQRLGIKLSDKDVRLLGQKFRLSERDIILLEQRFGLSRGDIRQLGQRIRIKGRVKLKQLQRQRLKPKRKLRQTQKQRFKKVQRQKLRLKQILKQKSLLGLRQEQLLKQSQLLQVGVLQKPILKQLPKFKQLPKIKELQKIKEREIIKLKLEKIRMEKKFLLAKARRKKIRKKRKPLKPQAFSVYARPLKRPGQKKKPKLIKVSKVALSKKRAKDLRNYITDTSLSRRAMIRPSKGKPSVPRLKTPPGYSRKTTHKFRTYKIRKGKRIYLKKGSVLEKGKHLLDTRQEVKQITLRRRIAQLSKPPKKRKPTPKRKPTKRKRPVRRDRGIFG